MKSTLKYMGGGKGPADFFDRFGTVFKTNAIIKANEVTKKWAEEVVKEAKRVLENQTYNWKPLKEYYKKRKIKMGLDERILIATGFYKNHIEAWTYRGRVHFGVRKTVIHEPSGLPLYVIARIHEFGTRTVPARPLWRPVFSKMLRRMPKMAKEYRKAVKQATLSKIGGSRKKRVPR